MEIKEEVKDKHKQKIGEVYNIALGYKLFLGEHERVHWSSQVWSNWNIPKHCFILWLAFQNGLSIRDILARFMENIDTSCVFCQRQTETKEHLFFYCEWVRKCLKKLMEWLDWKCSAIDLNRLLRWIQRSKMTKFRKNSHTASVAALVYYVWKARNKKIWSNEDIS